MSSYLVAKGVGESLNGTAYEVRIIRTASGSDSEVEFLLDGEGFALIYESEEDNALLPGIVSSKCVVNTMWPTDVHTDLNDLLTALTTSQDGDYLIEVLQDSQRLWVGPLLVEEFVVEESSSVKQVQMSAGDGLNLLRYVDYNDDGSAYTGAQKIHQIINNLQAKWACYDYLDAQNSGTEYRLAWAEDVYNEDDYLLAAMPHPAGTDNAAIRRYQVNCNIWSKTNDNNDIEYVSAYDVLQSLCVTFQWRMYSYGDAWYFLPCNLTSSTVQGSVYQWDGTLVSRQLISAYRFQKDDAYDIRQKSSDWVYSFTPPANEVKLHRKNNKGYLVIAAAQQSNGATVTDQDVIYDGQDTFTGDDSESYRIQFSCAVENAAVGSAGDTDAGQLIVEFVFKWDDGGDAVYWVNGTEASYQYIQASWLGGSGFDAYNIVQTTPSQSATAGTYTHVPDEEDRLYLPAQDMLRFFDGSFYIPPPLTTKTGLSVTATVKALDNGGSASTTYSNALTVNFTGITVARYRNGETVQRDNYDIVSTADTGRFSYDLGTSYIGGVASNQIKIETQAGAYTTSSNWVNQASDTTRSINRLSVAESLFAHNQPKSVERGSIVLRGTSATVPKPFARFLDNDTGTYYWPVNYVHNATRQEIDVTLRKMSRNALSAVFEEANIQGDKFGVGSTDGQEPPKPVPVVRAYNKQAADIFEEDWSGLIGSETLEAYYTVLPDGTGRSVDNQGESPRAGYDISRKIYYRLRGLHGAADGGWLALPTNQPALNDSLNTAFGNLDTYMAELSTATAGSYSFVVTYSEVSNLLLDSYSGATAAYGLRRLRAGYTGNAIEVTDGSTTQDIGFDSNGDLDQSALETYANGAAVKVSKWYDQALGNNLAQTSDAARPTITDSSGNMLTLNGKPAIKFNGAQSLPASSNFNANVNVTELVAAWVGSVNKLTVGNNMVSHWASSTGSQVFQVQFTQANDNLRWATRYSNGQLHTTDNGSAITNGAQYIVVGKAQHNNHEADFDGTNVIGGTPGAHVNDATTSFRVGARSDNSAGPHTGFTQEVIVFSRSTALDDHEDIADTINEYFSSY
jgi:hypothetical protein